MTKPAKEDGMADDAKGPNEIQFNVSDRQISYLVWLAENTILGRTEKEVARYLLTKLLEEMRQSGYQEDELPGDD